MARMVTYECRQCGTKVIVTKTHETSLQPIFCCGMEVAEVDSVRRRLGDGAAKGAAKRKKAIYGRSAGKTVKEEVAPSAKASARKEARKKTKKK